MAGRGPAPKSPARRARRNKDAQSLTRIRFEPGVQPGLPDAVEWPEITRQWWAMWAESPLSDTFGVTDWDFLLDTALLHRAAWSGDLSVMGELRLRVSKFGATPEDRARLRIQFADADEKDPQDQKGPAPARQRYGNVTKLTVASSD